MILINEDGTFIDTDATVIAAEDSDPIPGQESMECKDGVCEIKWEPLPQDK